MLTLSLLRHWNTGSKSVYDMKFSLRFLLGTSVNVTKISYRLICFSSIFVIHSCLEGSFYLTRNSLINTSEFYAPRMIILQTSCENWVLNFECCNWLRENEVFYWVKILKKITACMRYENRIFLKLLLSLGVKYHDFKFREIFNAGRYMRKKILRTLVKYVIYMAVLTKVPQKRKSVRDNADWYYG